MTLTSVLEFRNKYRGKDSFLLYVQTEVLFTENTNDLAFRDDLFESYNNFCQKNQLTEAVSMCIAQHIRGSGIRVQRRGPTSCQRFCYIGMAWPEGSTYITVHPGQVGRKRLNREPGYYKQQKKLKLMERSQHSIDLNVPNTQEWNWGKKLNLYVGQQKEEEEEELPSMPLILPDGLQQQEEELPSMPLILPDGLQQQEEEEEELLSMPLIF